MASKKKSTTKKTKRAPKYKSARKTFLKAAKKDLKRRTFVRVVNKLSPEFSARLAESVSQAAHAKRALVGEETDFTLPASTEPVATTDSPAINLTLRQPRYGRFQDRAHIAQNIQRAMQDHSNWQSLNDDQRQALQMIADKASRILNGDPDYPDSWDDLAAYARLVSERLQGRAV